MKCDLNLIDMCASLHAYTKNRDFAKLQEAIEHAISTAKREVAAKKVLGEACLPAIKHSDYRGPNA